MYIYIYIYIYIHRDIHLHIYRAHQGKRFVRCRAYRLSWSHGFKFKRWVGWWWKLGLAPNETPVNQKTNQKNSALQNVCPKLISRPQAQSFINLRLIEWLVWKCDMSTVYLSHFPEKNRNPFHNLRNIFLEHHGSNKYIYRKYI